MIRFAEKMLVACAALDRAETLSALITEDGEVIRTKTGLKSHPSIRDEIQLRAFVVRTLHRLGLDVEPLRSGPGKPPSTYGGGRPLKGGTKMGLSKRKPIRRPLQSHLSDEAIDSARCNGFAARASSSRGSTEICTLPTIVVVTAQNLRR